MKKAQGLPITVIIIAILGLVVLFVLLGIFGFRAQKFGKEVSSVSEEKTCADSGGELKPIMNCNVPLLGKFSDVTAGIVCCEKTS